MKKKLLIMTDWFYPGFKGGGTATTCFNLAMLLKDECMVYIMTLDRDFGVREPYKNIVVDHWVDFCDNVQIQYCSPGKLKYSSFLNEVKYISPDSIYLNSMFSLYFSIYPMMMKRTGLIKVPVILSPSGMIKESALKIRSLKKKTFLALLNILKIQQSIKFQATDDQEKSDIIKTFGKSASITQVPYAAPPIVQNITTPLKEKGALKMLFTGRIHPVKNLHFVLECLMECIHKIDFTVVGPVEDSEYFELCIKLAKRLPSNIKIDFVGGVANEQIQSFLKENHILILPSLGENYGYSIVEALVAGRPVIISDMTPWKDLFMQMAGWDLPLKDPEKYIAAISSVACMGQEEYNLWSSGALKYGRRIANRQIYLDQYKRMFGFTPA